MILFFISFCVLIIILSLSKLLLEFILLLLLLVLLTLLLFRKLLFFEFLNCILKSFLISVPFSKIILSISLNSCSVEVVENKVLLAFIAILL